MCLRPPRSPQRSPSSPLPSKPLLWLSVRESGSMCGRECHVLPLAEELQANITAQQRSGELLELQETLSWPSLASLCPNSYIPEVREIGDSFTFWTSEPFRRDCLWSCSRAGSSWPHPQDNLSTVDCFDSLIVAVARETRSNCSSSQTWFW